MEDLIKNNLNQDDLNYSKDYYKIIENSKKNEFTDFQWIKAGDYFPKISLYDESYLPFTGLGCTTLIEK